ncbi:murein biosynthesis integral membrane protein MurJ [Echinimonas agarilytica]|uniref:Probable lipid II flippase MurJ n=2 Tax=Echinimonas agarilytica TaxID=1215918 RepID=A0AA41W933_9GAMM|nr:murein biosynthesis integral membrane protein MurJ [Echinimonas agarilytica]
MTLISRVLGLVRDVVVANLMGAGAAADVFFFANKIPNFLRRLFAEGAFAQAFVPVLAETKAEGDKDGVRQLIAYVSGTLGTLVMIATIVGVVGSPVLAAIFGTGWFIEWLNDGPEAHKFETASLMLKITFPYLFFIALTALSGSILNTYGRFAVAAFTPVFLNIAIISCALLLSPTLDEPALGLAWGVFLGGIIQFLFQIPFLKRAGFLVKPKWGWRQPGVVKIRTLMIPALFGVSVSQLNLLFDTFIASFLMTGSISWLYYADRLLEFPLGLFGIAIATVVLPSLSSKAAAHDKDAFKHTMDWGVRMVSVLGLPAALGLIVLAQPILMLLFMRGEYTSNDVLASSYSLFAYASGLLFFMYIKVLAPGYFARQDTKTPVKFGIYAMVSNMVFNVILASWLGYIGLAAATSLSALLNAGLLYWGLRQLGVFQLSSESVGLIIRMLISAVIMAFSVWYLSPEFKHWLQFSFTEAVFWLVGLMLLAASVYTVMLGILGVRVRHLMR